MIHSLEMKTIFLYTRFFFYIAYNWNAGLAIFMLYHDIRGYYKYRISTFVPVNLERLTIHNADISKSSPYEAVNYYMLEALLKTFRQLSPVSSIVDLGCGKGRVMVVAAHHGFTSITGIDFAKELCGEAIRNMQKTEELLQKSIEWKVINAHVLGYDIQPGDAVFFMFNPFVAETLDAFLDKLEASRLHHPRKTWFLYASPQHAAVLEKKGYAEVYHKKLMNLEGIIFSKD